LREYKETAVNRRAICAAALCACLLSARAFAVEAGGGQQRRGDDLTLKIAVIGPGDALYLWWGHIALVIEDAATGNADLYDYGVFSFEDEHFFVNFALGRLWYKCDVSPAGWNLDQYIRANRDVTLYTLNLSPQKKETVKCFAERNALPENRNYLYHHFRDNCATRIRDIIDEATDGQFKARVGDLPGRHTFRQHIRRYMLHSPFFDWFLCFLMGHDIDKPLTVWDELFLPSEIGRRIADFHYTDESGAERPLVSATEKLNRAINRPPVPDAPNRQWARGLAAGAALAALAALLAVLSAVRKKRPGRALWGAAHSLLGLSFGLAGTVLLFLTFFTNHDYTYRNSNVLFVNPLLLLAVPWGLRAAQGREREDRRFSADARLHALWTYVFCAGTAAELLNLLPKCSQQNQATLALLLPTAFISSFIPARVRAAFQKKARARQAVRRPAG
jgi:hypothetical protein